MSLEDPYQQSDSLNSECFDKMTCQILRYSRHALDRMFQRGISPDVIERIAKEGSVIATYPDDKPYPSKLILGFEGDRPIHIVIAVEPETREHVIVTVYQPDSALWNETYSSRRAP